MYVLGEIGTLKLIFGIFLAIWSVVLFFIAFRFFYRYTQEQKRCTVKTEGEVVGYEGFSRNNGISLPILKFEVNGQEYKTVGPRYKSFKTVKIRKPSLKTGQEYTADIFSQTFSHKITGSGMVVRNPMQELFPVGSTLPIFYDPENPKLSYVLRYCEQAWLFWMTITFAIITVIINIGLQVFL